jgi:hypothetical protein
MLCHITMTLVMMAADSTAAGRPQEEGQEVASTVVKRVLKRDRVMQWDIVQVCC